MRLRVTGGVGYSQYIRSVQWGCTANEGCEHVDVGGTERRILSTEPTSSEKRIVFASAKMATNTGKLLSKSQCGIGCRRFASRRLSPMAVVGRRSRHGTVVVRCMGKTSRAREEKAKGFDQEELIEEPAPEESQFVSSAVDTEETESKTSATGKPVGWSFFKWNEDIQDTSTEADAIKQSDEEEEEDDDVGFVDMTAPTEADGALPEVTQEQVVSSCASVCFIVFAMGFPLKGFAEKAPDILGTDADAIADLLRFPPHFDFSHFAIAMCAAGAVTGARKVLMGSWRDFAIATNRSNKQVLKPLTPFDIVLISALPGVSEEFLFRVALVPAIAPDWRGVLVSGLAFGVLHNSGGRNWAFAAWASAVGTLYGFAFLATQDMYVPMLAHSVANAASAFWWLADNPGIKDE